MTTDTKVVNVLKQGESGTIVTDETVFYATMGGQQGDAGFIEGPNGTFEVTDTIKLVGQKVGHVGVVKTGAIRTGDRVVLRVDEIRRRDICRNHSATHLLQKALRDVLGTHVEQAGSYQDAERTRFDFSHFQAMTDVEIRQVEEAVNDRIRDALPVETAEMSMEDARKTGAMALFNEKYGDTVRVVSMGDYSKELCGGTHVKNTADIRNFKIVSESGIAAGVRRIEALTGRNVYRYYEQVEETLNEAARAAKTTPQDLVKKIEHLNAEIKQLSSELDAVKSQAAKEAVADVMDQVQEVKGVKLLAVSVPNVEMNGLRDLSDQLSDKLADGVVVLASAKDGKVSLVVKASDGAQKKGAHAGNLIKAIAGKVGGGGGGRPNMAQAGGKNPAGIDEALAEAVKVLETQIP